MNKPKPTLTPRSSKIRVMEFRGLKIKIIALILVIILLCVMWLIDSKLYDNDLEEDHVRETGLTWEQIERVKS